MLTSLSLTGLLNQLAAPIRSSIALMKAHSPLENDSRKQENDSVVQPVQAVFDALLQPRTKKKTACILCPENFDDNKVCPCGLKFRSDVKWNSKTAETIRAATHLQSSKKNEGYKASPSRCESDPISLVDASFMGLIPLKQLMWPKPRTLGKQKLL